MITIEQYAGPHAGSADWTHERQANATKLLFACSQLEAEMADDGVAFPDNPATGSGVSGQRFGGFRPQSCPEGAPHSAHKEGLAVDRYDPNGSIDDWLMADYQKNAANGTAGDSALMRHGIYIEHPGSTRGWSHWSIRAPGSGNHVFFP